MSDNNKISLKVNFENDIRRITLSEPSYVELRKILLKLYRIGEEEFNNTLQIKYKDDENDIITVSSDDEFQEAILLTKTTGPILRLFLVKNTPKQQKNSSPQQGQRFAGFWKKLKNLFDEGTKESLESARKLLQDQLSIRPKNFRYLYNLVCVEALLGNLEQALDYLEKAIFAGWKNVAHMERDTDLDALRHLEKYKNLVSLIQKTYSQTTQNINFQQQQNNSNCHGFPFQNNNCPGFGFPFQPPHNNNNCHGYSNPFQPQNNTCHNNDSPLQWHFLHQQINHLFDMGTPESFQSAKTLLQQQLSINPHHPVPIYNLACVESLLGNLESGLKFLEEAIQAGYKDVDHIEKDRDLDALRHLEKFKILVASLKNTKPNVDGPCPSVSSGHPWGDLLKNLVEMGFIDQNKNEVALSMAQGDIEAAIQLLEQFMRI